MQAALKLKTTVLPGHRVEFTAPELPEDVEVELIVILPEARGRYPAALLAEYHALTDKKLRGTLTEAEAIRLEAIRAEIDAIDQQSPEQAIWERQAARLRAELAQLRAEIEALPDAEPTTP